MLLEEEFRLTGKTGTPIEFLNIKSYLKFGHVKVMLSINGFKL